MKINYHEHSDAWLLKEKKFDLSRLLAADGVQ
jgi:hypothetical protein